MKKTATKNILELKDSRLLFEKDLPPFGYILVSIIALALIGVVIWSTVTPKASVIKAQGLVESSNKNLIMAAYSGEINHFNIHEGSFVEEGDVLFTIKNAELELQQEQIQGQIAFYTDRECRGQTPGGP